MIQTSTSYLVAKTQVTCLMLAQLHLPPTVDEADGAPPNSSVTADFNAVAVISSCAEARDIRARTG